MGLDSLRALFSSRAGQGAPVSRFDPVTVAACALLLEIAHADDIFTPEERERIASHIRENRGVSDEELRDLFRAAEQERRDSVDLYHFTRLLNEHLSLQERRHLVETIWDVVYAHGELSSVESHLARRVAELLGFQHPEVQEIKEQVAARFARTE